MSATASIPSASNHAFDLRPCRRPHPHASLPSPSGRLMVLKQGDCYSASRRRALQLGSRNARRPPTKLRVVIIDQVVDTVEDVAEAVEDVAEVVEDAAEAVENAASDVADHLPAGEIKDAALWIENALKEVREDAGKTKDFMDMVDDLTEKVEKNVEAIVDSISEKKEEEAVLQKAAKMELEEQPENKATTMEEKKVQVEKVTGQTLGQEEKDAGEKAQPVEVRQP
ncbi:hypothetical protein ACLOJK_013500 [Asimina triloba]